MEIIAVKQYITTDERAIEAIKILRTNLMFTGVNTKAVALTSFAASAGKSTISFQLAASLAQAGKRVLLLDADMKKSSLHSRLQLKGKREGLSHYLSGMSTINELIYETDLPGLYLVFAGTNVPNSAELLGDDVFTKLISGMKEVFDYVIIDSAPVGQVVDCAVIAPKLDGVLLVVDTTNNSYKLEKRIKNQLEKSGAKVLGVVLNRVDFADKSGYYGKIYRAYNYGGYGIYGKNHNKDKNDDKDKKDNK